MDFSLKNKVAVITGGGRGIGKGIARMFAEQGAKVVVATRTESYGRDTVDALKADGLQAHLIVADVGKKQVCFDLVAETVRVFGDLDIMVHNAAAFPFGYIEALSDEELSATINTNLMGGIWLAQAARPHLIGKRAGGGGRLIYVTSLAGMRGGTPGLAHYGASKAGVYGFAMGAAAEFAPHGVTVNVVEPGVTRGDTLKEIFPDEAVIEAMGADLPLGRIAEPEDVALACLFFALPQASAITGQYVSVDSGSSTCGKAAAMVDALSQNADKLFR
jgi:3-oxoacyl-[acyl-carrier protein] reductase